MHFDFFFLEELCHVGGVFQWHQGWGILSQSLLNSNFVFVFFYRYIPHSVTDILPQALSSGTKI